MPGNTLIDREYSVAVTGDAFRWLVDYGNEDVLNKVRGYRDLDIPAKALTHGEPGTCVWKGIR